MLRRLLVDSAKALLAAFDPTALQGSRTGVFVGAGITGQAIMALGLKLPLITVNDDDVTDDICPGSPDQRIAVKPKNPDAKRALALRLAAGARAKRRHEIECQASRVRATLFK